MEFGQKCFFNQSTYLPKVMKKSAKQVMLSEVNPKDLEFDFSALQAAVADRLGDVSSMARATAPALIPLNDGYVTAQNIN